MLDWLNFHIDAISFLLGLATGTLFWILWGQFKHNLPAIQENLRRAFRELQKRYFSDVDVAIRQDALRRSQRSHLAAQLFPLDEIILTPKCIMPLPGVEPDMEESHNSGSPSIFPYMPDWPELPSQFGTEFISLPAALQNRASIVLIGRVGSGKTVALAYLASLLARKDPSLGILQEYLPIYLHISDILSQSTPESGGPTGAIFRAITSRLPILNQNRAPSYLKDVVSEARALLLLDGLDELAPRELMTAVQLIASLQKDQPDLQIVVTASPTYLDGIIRLGFQPMSLACWNRAEIEQFIRLWTSSWVEQIAPEIKGKAGMESIDPVFLQNWIHPEPVHYSPLEWVLILWAASTAEGGLISPVPALGTYLARMLPNPQLASPLQTLALELLKSQKTSFDQTVLDELLSRASLAQIQLFDPSQSQQNEEKLSPTASKPAKDSASISMQWVDALVQAGLFSEYAGHTMRFRHPVALAYLAAQCPIEEAQSWLADKTCWELRQLAVGYAGVKYPVDLEIPLDWVKGKPPLFRLPLICGRLLMVLPVTHPMRSRLLKRMAEGLMDPNAIPATRARFASVLACADDPSVLPLFRQLLASPNPAIRATACLVVGALQDIKSLDPLTQLLSDPDEDVRRNACYSLATLPEKTTLEILTECLSADDEIIRQAAAEALARDSLYGHPILKEVIKSENLLTRRSVVFGLACIHEPWAKELLSQVAVQDGQWVVRNAASQALDGLDKPDLRIPRKLPAPSKTPWLFDYASKIGKGIPADDLAIEILLHALSSGQPDEQIAALQYLRTYADEIVQQGITTAAVKAPRPINESAQLALWIYEACYSDQTRVARVSLS